MRKSSIKLWLNSCNLKLGTPINLFGYSVGVLLHVNSQLSVQSTQALLCLGSWGKMGLVKDNDVMADVDGEEEEFEDGWDAIQK